MSRIDTLKRGAKSTALQRILSAYDPAKTNKSRDITDGGQPGFLPGRLGRQTRSRSRLRLGSGTRRHKPSLGIFSPLVVTLGQPARASQAAAAAHGQQQRRLPRACVLALDRVKF
jgi:hypothetical protein